MLYFDVVVSLNEEQKEALTYVDGPALVLAGPGTGKTHTIASRVVYLIEKGFARPEDIFVITFTNRAARELYERISSYLKKQSPMPFVGTFHRLGLEILRNSLSPAPEIVSEYEQREILKALGIKGRVERIIEQISFFKNTLKEPDGELSQILSSYDSYLKEHDLIDIDDILTASAELIESLSPQSGLHLIIDEYQDINPSANRFVNAFLRGSRNLFVVGDPDQAIYSFRGSSIGIILDFQKQYPDAKVFNLKRSYRLSKEIVSLAEEVIKPNSQRLKKETIPLREGAKRPELVVLPDQFREAEYIASVIERQVGGSAHYSLYKGETFGGSRSFSSFAVLVRLKALMPLIERKLTERGIPVRRVTGIGALEYPLLRTVLERIENVESTEERGIVELLKELLKEPELSSNLSAELKKSLLNIASNFEYLPTDRALKLFIDELKMLSDTDLIQDRAEQVTLLTMHAAKGLEFDVVFIAGAEDGVVPYTKKDDWNIEEERRLFYVALTRAKEEVIITCAKRRTLFGRTEYNPPSRFLNLPEHLIEKTETLPRREKSPKQDSLF